jgi:hypothetical protein
MKNDPRCTRRSVFGSYTGQPVFLAARTPQGKEASSRRPLFARCCSLGGYELGAEPVTTRETAQATVTVAVAGLSLPLNTVPVQPADVG